MGTVIDYSKRNTWKGGRKRKPTAEKESAGTLRPCRENPNEPEAILTIGANPPEYLSPQAKEAWLYIVPKLEAIKILSESDLPILETLCDSWAEYRQCSEQITPDNMVIDSFKGSQVNPLISIRNQAWDRFRRLALEFGMTPASRSKASVIKDTKTDTEAEKLEKEIFG